MKTPEIQDSSNIQPSIEETPNNIDFAKEENRIIITFKDLALTPENPYSPKILVTFEKKPISIIPGQIYNIHSVKFDQETEQMQQIAQEAEKYKDLPESERPRKILELLRTHLHYAFPDLVEEIAKSDPELAKWIEVHTGTKADYNKPIPLSEIFEKQYCTCKHLSVAYLWLISKVGLNGVLCRCSKDPLKNILRTDTNKKLFSIGEIGESIDVGHSWTEIFTNDKGWIPADPATRLVGDDEKGIKMFEEANYLAGIDHGLQPEDWTDELIPRIYGDYELNPCEKGKTIGYFLELRKPQPILIIGPGCQSKQNKEVIIPPPLQQPYFGNAKLIIKQCGIFNIEIKNIQIDSSLSAVF